MPALYIYNVLMFFSTLPQVTVHIISHNCVAYERAVLPVLLLYTVEYSSGYTLPHKIEFNAYVFTVYGMHVGGTSDVSSPRPHLPDPYWRITRL